MTDTDPGWRTHSVRTVFDRGRVRVTARDVTAPAGDRFDLHVVHLDPVAVALVVDPGGAVLMLRTYRPVADRHGWELPGGLVEPGEDPVEAAARETAEETGWRPRGPGRAVTTFEPLPGGVSAPVHVHRWAAAEPAGAPRDPHEPGRARWVPGHALPAMAARGELLGSGTLVGVLTHLVEVARAGPG